MLPVCVSTDTVFEHHPAVKPQVCAFFGHCKAQFEIIFVRLLHRVYRVARPLVICHNFPCDHICLSAVRLKRIYVVHQLIQKLLCLRNGFRAHIIHHICKPLCIVCRLDKSLICQLVLLQNTKRCKIRIAHIILQGNLPVKFGIAKDFPSGSLLLCHKRRIIEHACDSPHVACGIRTP